MTSADLWYNDTTRERGWSNNAETFWDSGGARPVGGAGPPGGYPPPHRRCMREAGPSHEQAFNGFQKS